MACEYSSCSNEGLYRFRLSTAETSPGAAAPDDASEEAPLELLSSDEEPDEAVPDEEDSALLEPPEGPVAKAGTASEAQRIHIASRKAHFFIMPKPISAAESGYAQSAVPAANFGAAKERIAGKGELC